MEYDSVRNISQWKYLEKTASQESLTDKRDRQMDGIIRTIFFNRLPPLKGPIKNTTREVKSSNAMVEWFSWYDNYRPL